MGGFPISPLGLLGHQDSLLNQPALGREYVGHAELLRHVARTAGLSGEATAALFEAADELDAREERKE